MRLAYGLGLIYLTFTVLVLRTALPSEPNLPVPALASDLPGLDVHDRVHEWFKRARPHCNTVEAKGYLRARPAPEGFLGQAHGSACLALGGELDLARGVISSLPSDQQWRAAGILFDIAHPAADAGDELAAGPIMELVVAFWPNHYMALYHAGAARFERDEFPEAQLHLERFLVEYAPNDGWHESAVRMLEDIRAR